MKTNTIHCPQSTKRSLKNFAGYKALLVLLLFIGVARFGNATPSLPTQAHCDSVHDAPSCNLLGPLVACVNNGEMTDTLVIDFSSNPPELTISLAINTSGASIDSSHFISYMDSEYIQVIFINPGTHNGSINIQEIVDVSYPDGCIESCECSKSVTIIDIGGIPSAPPITCLGGTTTLTVAGSGGSTYIYTLQPGNVQNNTGIFPNLAANTYTVTVAGTKQGITCDASVQYTIQPGANPPALNCTNTGPLTCTTSSVTLSANSCTGTGVTYGWSGPGGYTSGIQCPSASAAGTYTVTAMSVAGCTNTCSTTVTSNGTPPSLNCSNNGPLTCTTTSVTLSANNCTGTGITYAWRGPSSYSSSIQCPTATVAGTYTVTATSTANGCTSTCTTTVGNTPPPTISCSNNGPMTCSLTSVTLTANNCTGTGINYSWRGPYGFTSISQCPTASGAGTYTVTATSANGTCPITCTTTVDSSCGLGLWGCTLGFWKNHTSIWDNNSTDAISQCVASAISSFGSGYSGNGTINSSFASTFGLTSAQMTAVGYSPSLTLIQALNLGGGGYNDFARQCVAALLNGCGLSGHYFYNTTQVITIVHNAIVSKNPNPITPSFDDQNQNPADMCPSGGPASKRLANGGIVVNDNVTISAYPNPFDNMTTIEILPNINYDAATVELYSINGQKVSTLFAGPVVANQTYRFQVNGMDLSAGIYVYSFKAGDEAIFGKVVLIK